MESGDELLAPQDTATVWVAEEIREANKQRNHWWTEDNWPRLKEALANIRYPYLKGHCDEDCLVLGFDTVPKKTVFNVLRGIGRKPVTYENVFTLNNREFLSENQVKYVEDIIIKIDTANLGISRKEVIQVISELGQAKSFVQAYNHLE